MIATRHRTDSPPALARPAGFAVRREHRVQVMAALRERPEFNIGRRLLDDHRAYVASIDGIDVAWGWVATATAVISELQSSFDIPKHQRYLWNFVTLSSYRGLGIYPRLLDETVRIESREADRFWVAYAPENHASGAGIHKAGFQTVAQISFDRHGRPALRMLLDDAANPACMLGLPNLAEALAQCWRCVRMGRTVEASCRPDACQCDYQQPLVECA